MDDITSDSRSSQAILSTYQLGPPIPTWFGYLSLMFQMTMTAMILPMAGWVFVTIKATRSLHRPHNIFVANLMAVDIVVAIVRTTLTVYRVTGLDILNCNLAQFSLSPIVVLHFTYLMIAVDKMIAITMPYRHKKIMTPRVVSSLITTAWIVSLFYLLRGF